MIKLLTNCEECIHKNVCSYKNNAEEDMSKLKETCCSGANNLWDIMMESRHVDITFSCHDFMKPGLLSFSPGTR